MALPVRVSPVPEPVAVSMAAVAGVGGGVLGYLMSQEWCAQDVSKVAFSAEDEKMATEIIQQSDTSTKHLIVTLAATGLGVVLAALIVYCMLKMPDREVQHMVYTRYGFVDPLSYHLYEMRRAKHAQFLGGLAGIALVMLR